MCSGGVRRSGVQAHALASGSGGAGVRIGGGVAVFTPDGVFTVTLHTHTCSARPCEQGLTAN